jgi:hypothetical protein
MKAHSHLGKNRVYYLWVLLGLGFRVIESQPLYKIYPKPKCFFDMKQNVGPISKSEKQCNQQLMSGWLKKCHGKASNKKRVG